MDNTVLTPLAKEENTFFKRLGRLFGRIKTSEYLYLFAAFLLPFTIMLGVYACMGIHPFGNNSVLILDLQAQYIYYYEEIRSLLTEGGSFLYSWKRTLGGEFMGIIAYYGASIYNLFFVVFPKSMIADAMMFINLMKIGSMGLTFGIYIHKTRRPGEMKTIALSTMYALCAYSVVQTINPMWLDAVVFLPLLILGLERLITEKKMILYTVTLTYIFIANYYIGYMTGIFTFIYFLYYYFSSREELVERYPAKEGNIFKRFFSSHGTGTFVRFALGTLVALMVASFMLIAAIYSLSFGKTDFQQTNWNFALRFDFLEIIYKMFIGSYDTVNTNGLPMIYSGILAIICVPVYFMSPDVKPAKKIGASLVLLAIILSFMINPADLVWHGFNLPNWLNYRYSFVFSFMVISMAADALRSIDKIKTTSVLGVGGILMVIVAFIQADKFPIDSQTTGAAFAKANIKTMYFALVSILFIVAYMIIIHLISHKKSESVGAFALALIVCAEMFCGSLINMSDLTDDVGMVRYGSFVDASGNEDYTSYNAAINRIKDIVDQVTENDTSFYRMESKVYRRLGGENESMAFGFNGIAHSTSTLNSSVIRLLNNMGYASVSHWTKYLGSTPVSDALLGIKYVVTCDELLGDDFYTVKYQGLEHADHVQPQSMIYAFENNYALPIAYGVSANSLSLLDNLSLPYYYTGMDIQNRMIDAFLSETLYNGDVFKKASAIVSAENCDRGSFSQPCTYYDENGEKKTIYVPYDSYVANGDDPTVVYNFVATESAPYYLHFPTDNFGKTGSLYVNGAYVCDYGNTGIVYIGDFTKGEKVRVTFEIIDAFYISDMSGTQIYYLDSDAAKEALTLLKNAGLNITDYSNKSIEGTINLPEGQELILTTIPYDKGWNCYLDGEKVEGVRALGSLLAIEATAGEHTLELRYMPKEYIVGFIVSALGIIILALMIILPVIKKKRAAKKASAVKEEAVAAVAVPDGAESAEALEEQKFREPIEMEEREIKEIFIEAEKEEK